MTCDDAFVRSQHTSHLSQYGIHLNQQHQHIQASNAAREFHATMAIIKRQLYIHQLPYTHKHTHKHHTVIAASPTYTARGAVCMLCIASSKRCDRDTLSCPWVDEAAGCCGGEGVVTGVPFSVRRMDSQPVSKQGQSHFCTHTQSRHTYIAHITNVIQRTLHPTLPNRT